MSVMFSFNFSHSTTYQLGNKPKIAPKITNNPYMHNCV